MKIPKSINVGGHTISVKQIKCFKGNPGRLGTAYLTAKKIKLSRTCCGDKICQSVAEATFLHEIIHHIDAVYGIRINESQVRRLSEGLYQVLKDNKLRF